MARVGPVELFLVLLICLVPLTMAAVVAVVVVLLNRRRTPASAQGGHSALDVLKERYARGELTRQQYEEMRRDLES